jgi:hypothetical protein
VKGVNTQTSKKQGKKSKNPDITKSRRGVWQRKFRSTWGERMQEKERCRNEEGENRYWMEGEERRCRMCNERERERQTIEHTWNGREGEKATGRNIEWRWTGDKMDEIDMEEEGNNRKRNGLELLFLCL